MLGHVPHQIKHLAEAGPIDQVTAPWLNRHKPGMNQLFQVKRQSVARHRQLLDDGPWRQPFRTSHHQSAKGTQALGLRQRGQGGYGLNFSNISMIQRLLNY